MFRPVHCSRTDERALTLMEFRKERLLCYVMTEKHTKKNDGKKRIIINLSYDSHYVMDPCGHIKVKFLISFIRAVMF